MIKLIDKRGYAVDYPKTNIVIKGALEVLQNCLTQDKLESTMGLLLKNDNDPLINVALNLSPDFTTSSIIWRSLHNAINNLTRAEQTGSCIFAIPIIFVMGSRAEISVKGYIDDGLVNQFFEENNLISGKRWFISGKLIDAKMIAKIKPSQYYHWVRTLKEPELWLPVDFDGAPFMVKGEGVLVRFLVGVISGISCGESLNQLISFSKFHQANKMLMDLLVNQLRTDGVTFFPIPFEPCYLSNSYEIADNYRKEIVLSVALSNAVRQIKQAQLTPVVKLSMQNNSIEIAIQTLEESSYKSALYWSLTPYDNLEAITNKIDDLITDIKIQCQVNN